MTDTQIERTDGWLNRGFAALWNLGHAVAGSFRNQTATPERLAEIFRHFETGGAETWAGEPVSATRAMQTRAVNSCVQLLAETQAMLPLETLRRDPDTRVTTPATDLPLYDLLKTAPNEWQTSFEWREMGTQHLELRGNFYNFLIFDAVGQVIEMLPMHPDRVEPVQDKTTLRVVYEWTRPDGTRITLPADRVLHVKRMTDDRMVKGVSTVQHHRETIGEALAVQRQGGRFWSNAARPHAVLKLSDSIEMKEDEMSALRTDFEEMYRGGDNAYRTAILPGGVDFEALSMTMEDAQFLESRKFTRTEIAGMFRVPPHLIGDLEKSTFSNVENLSLQFVVYTMQPRVTRWEQALTKRLIADPNVFIKHNLTALLRGDAKTRNEALQIQRRNGVINANTWRELEDLDPRTDPGGDRYIVESNMQDDTQEGLQQNTSDPRSPSERAAGTPPPADDGTDVGARLRVVKGRLNREGKGR